jgi:1,4-alpha-glucan branching enzyme
MNLSPVPREAHRLGLPRAGRWRELLNTDAVEYGGSGVVNAEVVQTEEVAWHGRPVSVEVQLPPLGAVWLAPEGQGR